MPEPGAIARIKSRRDCGIAVTGLRPIWAVSLFTMIRLTFNKSFDGNS
jgi:hypothetical protein